MIITLIRRWFSTGSSLIVKGTVSFLMEAPFRPRLGSVAGSEERSSPMSVPVIKICKERQDSGVKSRDLLLFCLGIDAIYVLDGTSVTVLGHDQRASYRRF